MVKCVYGGEGRGGGPHLKDATNLGNKRRARAGQSPAAPIAYVDILCKELYWCCMNVLLLKEWASRLQPLLDM